ncbi:MAG: DUF2971 domain-containing protein [Roseateles sp.]|nr:MAG: DUF2971 domain-containing protein [Roseateles sp.]
MIHYRNHPALDDDVALWRYMGLDALRAMLSTHTLRLTRLDRFDDPFEGTVPRAQAMRTAEQFVGAIDPSDPIYLQRSGQANDPRRRNISWQTEMRQRREAQIRCAHASCWRQGAESDGMWRLYCANGGQGIAIRTTFGQLVRELSSTNTVIGAVQYRNYHEGEAFHDDIDAFFNKRLGFSYEQEVRVLSYDSAASHKHTEFIAGFAGDAPDLLEQFLYIPMRTPDIANEIVVSPYASREFETQLQELVESECPDLSPKVSFSELSERRHQRWV